MFSVRVRLFRYNSVDMDALKFAFEILIVGALALPWLAVLILMFPDRVSGKPISCLDFSLSVVPKDVKPAVTAVVIVALGYLLGSAVSRVSRDFFDDELWGVFPTEDQIRDGVYYDEYCTEYVLSGLDLPYRGHAPLPGDFCPTWDPSTSSLLREHKMFYGKTSLNGMTTTFDALVQEMFRLQEGELLLNGQDKVDRLKQYYDQITVLRGAAFNGFMLSALCAFGYCGNLRARWFGALRPGSSHVPACCRRSALGRLLAREPLGGSATALP